MWISISSGAQQIRASKGISEAIGTVIPKFKMCNTYRLKKIRGFIGFTQMLLEF